MSNLFLIEPTRELKQLLCNIEMIISCMVKPILTEVAVYSLFQL